MRRLALGLSLLVVLGVSIIGCGDGSSGGCPDGKVACDGDCIDEILPTLTSIQGEVFDISCTASVCHDAQSPEATLDLSSAIQSGLSLVDINSVQVPSSLRVAPDDSSASYLMNKLLGIDMALGTTRMPQLDTPLCTPKIEAIRQWIDDGAPVN